MHEVEIVEHLQINGLRIFFDTVYYRTPHVHREMELIWLAEGSLDVRIEHTQLCVQPGEMVLFHPGQLHEFRALTEDCTFLCVQVAPELVQQTYPAFARLCFDQPCPSRALPQRAYAELVGRLLRMTRYYLQRSEAYELICTGLICLMLGTLVKAMPHHMLSSGELAGRQQRNDRAMRLIQYVDDNYARKIRLSDFARAEGLSLGYVSHFAREVLGRSFQDYVDTVRFYDACKRMAAGQKRLVDVYVASGFSDYRYFSRAFHKRFGITPEEYRRRSQSPVQEETRVHHSVHSLEHFYSPQKSLELLDEVEKRRGGPSGGDV